MEKLSKATLKRFESINWDTKEYLAYPINLDFPFAKIIINEKVAITDFYLAEKDSIPLCSLICKTESSNSEPILSYGRGKKIIYKKLSQANCNWELLNIQESMNMAAIGCNMPIQNKITLNLI